MKKVLLFLVVAFISHLRTYAQAQVPFVTCPNVNVAVARAGTNSDVTNPYYIYTVNTTTGSLTQLSGGPLLDPSDGSNLQVNGVGINTADGFLYGLNLKSDIYDVKLVRFDSHYGVTILGTIPPPPGLLGVINTAAGDFDRDGNYYFTAASGGSPTTGLGLHLYLGKISNAAALTGAVAPVAEYYEVDYSSTECSGFVASLINPNDLINSGIKDIAFNPFTKTFLSYVTYPKPGSGNPPSQYYGQMIEFKPVAGSSPLSYQLVCTPVINTHAAPAEVAGTLIDKAGNFEVLMTDGTMGKMENAAESAFTYTGTFTSLNNATGLTYPIRADMTSCGDISNIPLPVKLSSFTATQNECTNAFTWVVEDEVNFSHYQLEQSFDGSHFNSLAQVPAKQVQTTTKYQYNLASAGRDAYYRLKMVDADGQFTYSKVIHINNSCQAHAFSFAIHPNPVGSLLNINWNVLQTNTPVQISIYNAQGAVVKQLTKTLVAGNSLQSIDVNNLPSGIYFIKAMDVHNNNSFKTQLVK